MALAGVLHGGGFGGRGLLRRVRPQLLRRGLTKNFACELVVSEETASRAGLDLSAFPQREVEIRGKREVLAIRTLASAGELPVTDGVLIHRAAANNTLRPEAPCRADSAGSG